MLAQIPGLIADRLAVTPDPARIVLLFFAYSFLGYLLECVVLTIDNRRIIVNRGFVSHLPFCVIYGFGCMAGFALLRPLADNLPLLALVGALGATVFEYLVAQLQIRLFGDFWWDYSEKAMNYQGIICLESTVGWALGAILVLRVVHRPLVALISRVPADFAALLAVVLVVGYLADFVYSARSAARSGEAEAEELYIEE